MFSNFDFNRRSHSLTVRQCIKQSYATHGLTGFYKGITASYYGVSETVIHFVIYEAIKAKLRDMKGQTIDDEDRSLLDFLEFMGAGATSKTIATCIAYPHGMCIFQFVQHCLYYYFLNTWNLPLIRVFLNLFLFSSTGSFYNNRTHAHSSQGICCEDLITVRGEVYLPQSVYVPIWLKRSICTEFAYFPYNKLYCQTLQTTCCYF